MLLDTSGLLCLQHRSELFHAQACLLYKTAGQRLTHSYILAEYIALATARELPRPAILQYVTDLVANSDITVVWVTETDHRAAMALLGTRLDKMYSLCDAVSFVLMRRLGITEALTPGRHFVQEGFRRLLADEVSPR